ncbi:MAG: divalent-cation tolerance protein CutA [Candidatus Omnitrophota bacterium]
MRYCVVLITTPRGGEPESLSRLLLKKNLCACVNIVRGIQSFFWWKGRIDRASEALLVVKTEQRLLTRLIREVRGAHSYSVCEVLALPVLKGNKPYLDWISSSLSGASGGKRRKGQSV